MFPLLGSFCFTSVLKLCGVCLFVLSERKREGPSFVYATVCVYCTSCWQEELRVQLKVRHWWWWCHLIVSSVDSDDGDDEQLLDSTKDTTAD